MQTYFSEPKDFSGIVQFISELFLISKQNQKWSSVEIISAKETCEEDEYATIAETYASEILENTENDDWALRYFAAQIYLELYAISSDKNYLQDAYQIAFDNVNNLVDGQIDLNDAYQTDVVEVKAESGATKREKKEMKEYNKMLKEERKTALPPVDESVYLNCDLLFALAKELDIPEEEKRDIEAMIHEDGEPLFLVAELDKKFWFSDQEEVNPDSIDVEFDGGNIAIPVEYVTDSSDIKVTVSGGGDKTVIEDWTIEGVERPKNADYTGYIATFSSKLAKKLEYAEGDMIQIDIVLEDNALSFQYKAKIQKKLKVITTTSFERLTDS